MVSPTISHSASPMSSPGRMHAPATSVVAPSLPLAYAAELPPVMLATAEAEQGETLGKARAFAEPLISGGWLDTGENILAHADAMAAILSDIGGSVAMHDSVHEGDVITISTPRNHFALHPAQRTVLLAGGIGVTPLLCMADRLARTGADFALHYCTRSVERTAFASEIAASAMGPHVHFHFDAGAPEQKLDLAAIAGIVLITAGVLVIHLFSGTHA